MKDQFTKSCNIDLYYENLLATCSLDSLNLESLPRECSFLHLEQSKAWLKILFDAKIYLYFIFLLLDSALAYKSSISK